VKKKRRNFIKVGSIKIPWCKLGDGRTCIDPRSLGLKRQTFVNHADAIAEAERIARERHNGGAELLAFTPADRGIYAQASADAKLFDLTLPDAMSEWRTVRSRMNGTPHSLPDIVAAGITALSKPVRPTIDIVAELITSKKPHDLNKRYSRGLATDLKAFAEAFPAGLEKIESREIEAFRDAIPHGIRRRNTALWNVRHLYSFAKKRNYLPADRTDAAQQVEIIEAPATRVEFYAVWEMELYLEHVREPFVPWLACNSFSGARHEEIVLARDAAKKKDPLRWEDFDWDDRAIAIRPETSKTGRARRIPILDNLFEILKPWRDRKAKGPICTKYPGDYETRRMVAKANKELEAHKDTRRVAWIKNAPRHSYCSYRMAIVQNEQQVSYESGNSIAMIRKHYHNPRPKSEAAAWFKLMRETPGNIIQLEIFTAA
jgi:integrase